METYPPAPEVAVLRMAAVLTSTGTPFTDDYLASRTVGARGILVNPGNRSRYRDIVADLVDRDLLAAGEAAGGRSPYLDGYTLVIITDQGRAYLDELATP